MTDKISDNTSNFNEIPTPLPTTKLSLSHLLDQNKESCEKATKLGKLLTNYHFETTTTIDNEPPPIIQAYNAGIVSLNHIRPRNCVSIYVHYNNQNEPQLLIIASNEVLQTEPIVFNLTKDDAAKRIIFSSRSKIRKIIEDQQIVKFVIDDDTEDYLKTENTQCRYVINLSKNIKRLAAINKKFEPESNNPNTPISNILTTIHRLGHKSRSAISVNEENENVFKFNFKNEFETEDNKSIVIANCTRAADAILKCGLMLLSKIINEKMTHEIIFSNEYKTAPSNKPELFYMASNEETIKKMITQTNNRSTSYQTSDYLLHHPTSRIAPYNIGIMSLDILTQ